jgi:hypothetical protein
MPQLRIFVVEMAIEKAKIHKFLGVYQNPAQFIKSGDRISYSGSWNLHSSNI